MTVYRASVPFKFSDERRQRMIAIERNRTDEQRADHRRNLKAAWGRRRARMKATAPVAYHG